MLSLRLQTTLHKKNFFQCCLNFLRTTLHKVTEKTLCHAVQDAGKILFNVVLILLRQHCTGKNFVQCCPRGSRQHCTRKNPVPWRRNTLGTTLQGQKPCAMLPKRLQTMLNRKKPNAMSFQ